MKDYAARIIARDSLRICRGRRCRCRYARKLLDNTFGGLPAKANLTPVADVQALRPPQRAFIPLDGAQTVVTFGPRHPPPRSEFHGGLS